MSQSGIERSALCIALVAAFISSGICCNSQEWKCLSGECIPSDGLCDGAPNCVDGSDETSDFCIQQICPSYGYRCAYGACVGGEALCNGVQDCADNSDEAAVSCDSDAIRKSNCSEEEFACVSGECIDNESACDGHADCPDQSDETVEACAANPCPNFAFRCGYGACIYIKGKCDGKIDCRDGSDEAIKLCGLPEPPEPQVPVKPVDPPRPPGSKPPTRPPPTLKPPTPKPPTAGCKAPNIPHSILVLEGDPTVVFKPGAHVQETTSIVYQCEAGYNREGPQFNLCFKSVWVSSIDAICIKYCPSQQLKGITFRAECIRDGATVPCDDRIQSGTIAKITCQVRYRRPARNPPDTLVCLSDGQWDYQPARCEPICGEELTRVTPFIVHGDSTNITYVPWHVGIYQRFSGVYKHNCGGTIISAKVVISAAHCFWDSANEKVHDKSFYLVGAGKYYRDYNKNEENAVFMNISEIAVPPEFRGSLDDYLGDIAVLVLTNFLRYSPFIAPACVDWLWGAAKSIPVNSYGRVAGWGLDETGAYSLDLRTVDVPTNNYDECRQQASAQYLNTIKNDKFCVFNKFGSVVCSGDSGGGLTVKTIVGGRPLHYMWGIVSGGVPYGSKCQEFEFTSFTNIQYYETMITARTNSNRG